MKILPYGVIGRDKDGNPIFDPKLKLKLLTRQQLEKLLKPKQVKNEKMRKKNLNYAILFLS